MSAAVHFSGRAHPVRQLHGKVARAGANVGHDAAFGNLEDIERAIRLLFLDLFRPIQPRRSGGAHHLCESPAADRMHPGRGDNTGLLGDNPDGRR